MLSGIEGSESYARKMSSTKRTLARWTGTSMSPRRIVEQTLRQLDDGECVLIPDYAVPVNRASFQMGLAVRSTRSPALTRGLSTFYRWLLDGDEVKQLQA